ncbi:aminotransferase class IV [Hymenobacter sp. CRA2]|uniref:aminotransferase class IV n=1 Tax=Hymenobacter sp. CRA2 TaxID=1955620 RepID=UPI0009901812|nr:aminotransferase class IV [Hymenobacter sp. CRA2]OON68982.1 amino acid aminotransferase [Hymenobacter sp. CRA2]
MSSITTTHAYVRGEFSPWHQAYLHISDLAIQRGYGVFDFFRVEAGQPLFLQPHLDRFFRSAELLELAVPLTRPELVAAIHELIRRNDLPRSGVKVLLTGGYSSGGFEPAGEASLIITQQPIELPTPEQLARGIRIISHEHGRELPEAKSINYVTGIRLLKELKTRGADDVLYHQHGLVTEFPRANFFIVRADDTVVTPAANVLAGITRQNVLRLDGLPYRVETGPVRLEDVRAAKEAFLASTTKRLMPVVQLDDHPIGQGTPGAVTRALLARLLELEKSSAGPSIVG